MTTAILYRDILTLNPANFLNAHQEWIDMSSVTHPTIRVYQNESYKPVQLPYALKSFPDGRRGKRQIWPDHSKGFLYYHTPPNRPRIAGEVRFRLTPTNDPSTFEQGTDLCFDDTAYDNTFTQTWKRPLYSLATNTSTRPLYDKLIEEGIIPPELDKSIQSLPKLTFMYSRCRMSQASPPSRCIQNSVSRSEVLCTKFDQRSESELACSLLACLIYFPVRRAMPYKSTLSMSQRINWSLLINCLTKNRNEGR
jgi:hypothetical protein